MATENKPLMRAMQDLRRSSAAQPHRSKRTYTRKRKHPKRDLDPGNGR